MSILEELWYGNVHPGEINIKKHSLCKELLALMIRHQDDLLSRLNDEEKEIFEKYADAASEMYSHTNREVFISGFTLGVKIMVEVFMTDDEAG